MASKIIGIEIGSNTLKLALCSGNVVKNMAVSRLPDNFMHDGKPTSSSALTSLVKALCKESGIHPGTCALVLPREAVIAHMVTMPVMSEAELALNLPFEFRDFVGADSDKYAYDYAVVEVKGNSMQLYAAAVRKDLVEQYYDIFRKAGMTLKAAMPAEMAWLNLIRSAKNEPDTICIVDMGHNVSRVNIFSRGNYEMGRDIDIAGAYFDKVIAEKNQEDIHSSHMKKESDMDGILSSPVCIDAYSELAVEVMKTVNFYRSGTMEGSGLQDIYYCGGSSAIEPLRTAILKRTDLSMHHIRRLLPCEGIDENIVLDCALAAGAAMQLQ